MSDPLIWVRAIHFAATALVAGTAFFLVFIAEPAFRGTPNDDCTAVLVARRLNRLARLSLALAVISGAVWFDLTAAAMSGAPATSVVSNGVWRTVLAETTFGHAWTIRFVLACILAGLFDPSLFRERLTSNIFKATLLVSAAGFVGALAWAGHAAGGLGVEAVLHPLADVLHLVAAAAWLGALIPLALLLKAAADSGRLDIARVATLRFSSLGVVSVATLLVTGSINTWYLAGSIAALTGTDYGRLLLIKIALFFGMVAIAAVNKLYLTPRIVQAAAGVAQRAVRTLERNAVLETAAGLTILAIVAVLGTWPPGSHADHHPAGAIPADASFQHIHTEQGMADVMIEPGRVGPARVTVHLWNADFGPLAAQSLTLSLTPPGGGATTTRSAVQDRDQAWQVDGIDLSQPGNWTVTLKATLGAGPPLVLQAPIVIDSKP